MATADLDALRAVPADGRAHDVALTLGTYRVRWPHARSPRPGCAGSSPTPAGRWSAPRWT
ncbi:hypothetical protein ACLFMI_25250 [Pseudonocardia nantongensis]|uniref:hypothetical protein n=1 Tax=Pseudonocardia nantongensis TaxID=1181885 RepID=UPI00397E3543